MDRERRRRRIEEEKGRGEASCPRSLGPGTHSY
jgi:hypothetical protein